MIGMTGVLGWLAIGATSGGAPIGDATFLVLMVILTAILAAAIVVRPIRWTLDEVRFAVGAPAVLGALVALAGIVLGGQGRLGGSAPGLVRGPRCWSWPRVRTWPSRWPDEPGWARSPGRVPRPPRTRTRRPTRPRRAGSSRGPPSARRGWPRWPASPSCRWWSTSSATRPGWRWATSSGPASRPATTARRCGTSRSRCTTTTTTCGPATRRRRRGGRGRSTSSRCGSSSRATPTTRPASPTTPATW